jgi:hypothetical protein
LDSFEFGKNYRFDGVPGNICYITISAAKGGIHNVEAIGIQNVEAISSEKKKK